MIRGSVKHWRIVIESDTLDEETGSRSLTPHFTIDSRNPPKIMVSCIDEGMRYLYSYPKPRLISKEKWE